MEPMADNTPKDTSLQSTKQLLDELDALMARMLSLHVDELEEELKNSPENDKPPTDTAKRPSLSASLTLLAPGDAAAEAPASLRESPMVKTSAPTAPAARKLRPKKTPHAASHP